MTYLISEHLLSCPLFMASLDTQTMPDCSFTLSIRSLSNGTLERVAHEPTIINFFCSKRKQKKRKSIHCHIVVCSTSCGRKTPEWKEKGKTLARVRATLIRCQSPSSVEVQFIGFSLDRTKDISMQSLSRPWTKRCRLILRTMHLVFELQCKILGCYQSVVAVINMNLPKWIKPETMFTQTWYLSMVCISTDSAQILLIRLAWELYGVIMPISFSSIPLLTKPCVIWVTNITVINWLDVNMESNCINTYLHNSRTVHWQLCVLHMDCLQPYGLLPQNRATNLHYETFVRLQS